MIISFFHDHYFMVNNNDDIYTTGSLDSKVWNNYLVNDHDRLIVHAREKEYSKKEAKSVSNCENVDFKFYDSISSISSLLLENKTHKEIEQSVKESDVVIARIPSEIGLFAAKSALKYNKKLICEVVACGKDTLFYMGGIKQKIYSYIMLLRVRGIIKRSPNVIYVTNKFLQNKYPNDNNQCSISDVSIDNYIENRKIDIKYKNKIKLGIIGNFSNDIKGVDIAIKAVSKSNLNLTLELVGAGDITRYKNLADNLNVDLIHKGILKHEEIFEWLKSIDIYLQPSRTEGLSRSVIEAMSVGCPVITSKAGGLIELTHPMASHNVNDVDGLLRCLNKLDNLKWIELLSKHSLYVSSLYKSEDLKMKRKAFLKDIYEA